MDLDSGLKCLTLGLDLNADFDIKCVHYVQSIWYKSNCISRQIVSLQLSFLEAAPQISLEG
jgi:hypothetical protein